MDISSIFQAVLDTKSDSATLSVAKLKVGDRLTGKVLRLEADGRALIDLGGFRAKAQIGFPVQKGQTLNLRVVQSSTPLHLQAEVKSTLQSLSNIPRLDFTQLFSETDQRQLVDIMNDMANVPKSQWNAVPSSQRILSAMTQIKAVFDTLPMDKPSAQLAQWLQGALEERGVLFEKKLADTLLNTVKSDDGSSHADVKRVHSLIMRDLKPQLLVLKSFLGGEGGAELIAGRLVPADLAFVRSSIDKLLKYVVQQQERLVQNMGEDDTFQIITHILAFGEQKLPVQFKIYYPKKDKKEKGDAHQHIALLLQMDRLGQVRADLSMTEGFLNIRIFVQDEAVRQLFEADAGALTLTLKDYFEEVVIVTRVSEEKIKQFDLHHQEQGPMGRIDIKV